MKKILTLFLFLAAAAPCSYAARFNPELARLLQAYQQGALHSDQGAGLDSPALPTHVTVWGSGDPAAVLDRGGAVIRSHYPYFTARIPLSRLGGFQEEPRIMFLSGGQKAHTLLSHAVPDARADQNWAAGYLGDDVIIGVIDDSLDPYHQDFYNDFGNSRILYLWDQYQTGVPPALFDYGHQWSREDIQAGRYVLDNTGFHGTHVTGIAAGSGEWSEGAYRGVSPHANIVMVRTEGYLYQIINGLDYILWQARQLGKPCVVNISMGFHFGNHQADDPFNQYMEEVLEYYGHEGNIVVWAAGNEAEYPIHTTNLITSSDTPLQFNAGSSGLSLSFYYPSDSLIPVRLQRGISTLIDFTTQSVQHSDASLTISSYTGRDKLVNVTIHNGSLQTWTLTFQGQAQNIPVHGYIENDVYSLGVNDRFLIPITNGTLSVSACMRNSLTVGSYISRTAYTNYQSTVFTTDPANTGHVSGFSSRGPSRDNQNKPEIVAPGEFVVAPLASEANINSDNVVVPGKYLAISGTSMAAPMVTGIVAHMLAVNPEFTVNEIRDLLAQYARGNAYKPLPGGQWDPAYGYGLIDASGILNYTVEGRLVQFTLKNNVLRPSAAQDNFLQFLVRGGSADITAQVLVDIYNGRGGLVYRYSPRTLDGIEVEEYEWNGTDQNGVPVPAGLYFILVQVDGSTQRYPVLVVE